MWSAASQQSSRNIDSFNSSLGPLTLDSPAIVNVLPRNAAGSTSCLALDGATVGGSFANSIGSVAADVTSLYRTQHQQQQVDFRSAYGSVTTCFRFATKSSGPDFYRLRRLLKRAKRQAAAAGRDDADVDGKGDDNDGCVSRYPLYCIVCRVHLNAQLQAKQHYKGRSHARRVRLLYGAPAITAGTASDPAFSPTASSSNDAEVSSVYCGASRACRKVCNNLIEVIT